MVIPDWSFFLFVISALVVFPFGLFFRRIGQPPALCLIGLIPFGICILPWMMLFLRWQAPPPLPKAVRPSRRG